ncbi:unnamed protein product, partial [Polarella glacialis]
VAFQGGFQRQGAAGARALAVYGGTEPPPRAFGGGCALSGGVLLIYGGWHPRGGTYSDVWAASLDDAGRSSFFSQLPTTASRAEFHTRGVVGEDDEDEDEDEEDEDEEDEDEDEEDEDGELPLLLRRRLLGLINEEVPTMNPALDDSEEDQEALDAMEDDSDDEDDEESSSD